MLVIRRKFEESIVLEVDAPATVRIVQLSFGNGKSTLGITAPQCVRIYRTELLEQQPGAAGCLLKGVTTPASPGV